VDEAVQIVESVDQPFTKVWAQVGVGLVHLSQGHIPAALLALESSLALWRQGDWVFMLPWVAAPLGRAYLIAGRVDEAIELLRQSADRTSAMNVIPLHVQDLTYLSEAYLAAGRHDHATAEINRALHLCRTRHQRLFEPDALRIDGEILAQRGDVRRALEAYLEALPLAVDLRLRPLVAHCHLGLGKLYRRTDQREQAHEHLATATTMYREMGMTYWLERAEGEMTELGG
jgi:tetratricopeptide (TPR) repeat protein